MYIINYNIFEFIIKLYLCRSLPDNGRVDDEKTMHERLVGLRNVMKDKSHVEEPIQAYIIPSVDSHQVIQCHLN